MNQKKIIFTLALCLMLIVIPARAEIYACEQQGFTFEYDPAYTAQWEEGNGVVLYTATPEYIPYVIVYRMGKGAMPNFDVDAYFRRDIKSMQDHYGDQLLSVEEGLTLMLGELKLPGVRYVYALSGLEINGQKARVEMMVFIHETEDAVRRYTVKYDPGKGDQTISAMAQAIQSFTAKEVPVTYETFICDEEGFSIEVDSSYNVVYEENNYVRIYTETRGKVPHATVWRLATDDLSSYDIDAMHSKTMHRICAQPTANG